MPPSGCPAVVLRGIVDAQLPSRDAGWMEVGNGLGEVDLYGVLRQEDPARGCYISRYHRICYCRLQRDRYARLVWAVCAGLHWD